MLRITEEHRKLLSVPRGKLYTGRGPELVREIQEIKDARFFAAIGDLVTLFSFQAGFLPDLAVVDFKTERKELEDVVTAEIMGFMQKEGYEVLEVTNPQGHISEELVEALKHGIEKGRTCIIVDGEEDMAALPLSVLLPENSVIIYGVPSRGIAAYVVSGEDKILISKMVEEMEEVGNDRVKKMLLEVR
ncbi:GTP-dependent dephospho-CoA kinase family protein [Geoglobus acetivorans]|uniref:GTP-dependent dephospho-CoA kinase n=1 Tax=Geoglobus acetivorans TaxID=565033 RepID=A0A0A7GD07_GEOAI|nr:hypothetical protein GACE_0913 [Geoglobus acetivorans]